MLGHFHKYLRRQQHHQPGYAYYIACRHFTHLQHRLLILQAIPEPHTGCLKTRQPHQDAAGQSPIWCVVSSIHPTTSLATYWQPQELVTYVISDARNMVSRQYMQATPSLRFSEPRDHLIKDQRLRQSLTCTAQLHEQKTCQAQAEGVRCRALAHPAFGPKHRRTRIHRPGKKDHEDHAAEWRSRQALAKLIPAFEKGLYKGALE